jgi:hypothetical protein
MDFRTSSLNRSSELARPKGAAGSEGAARSLGKLELGGRSNRFGRFDPDLSMSFYGRCDSSRWNLKVIFNGVRTLLSSKGSPKFCIFLEDEALLT